MIRQGKNVKAKDLIAGDVVLTHGRLGKFFQAIVRVETGDGCTNIWFLDDPSKWCSFWEHTLFLRVCTL